MAVQQLWVENDEDTIEAYDVPDWMSRIFAGVRAIQIDGDTFVIIRDGDQLRMVSIAYVHGAVSKEEQA